MNSCGKQSCLERDEPESHKAKAGNDAQVSQRCSSTSHTLQRAWQPQKKSVCHHVSCQLAPTDGKLSRNKPSPSPVPLQHHAHVTQPPPAPSLPQALASPPHAGQPSQSPQGRCEVAGEGRASKALPFTKRRYKHDGTDPPLTLINTGLH